MKTKSLWHYLSSRKKETVLAPLFKMLEACFELFIPLLVADIIDTGIKSGDTGYIVRRGILMIFFGILGFTLAVIAQYFSAKCAIGVSSDLRRDLFYHISELNYKNLDEAGLSSLITGMTSDINQVQNGVNWALRLFLRSPFIVFGAAIMASTISPAASVIFWITIDVLIFIIVLIMKLSMPLTAKVQKQLETVTRSFKENITGVRVVRAFNSQPSEKRAFNTNQDELYRRQIKVGKISSALNPLTFAVINAAIIFILWTGAINVDTGVLSQGQIIALINYMSQILVELIKFANIVLIVSKAMACFKRVKNILSIEPVLANGAKKIDTSSAIDIKLENVSFAFDKKGGNALENISFHISKGTHAGIIGATGSGKTTLINLIARFYERSCGSILINDIPIEDYDIASLTSHISLVPQKSVLFRGTLRENLKWGNSEASDEECFDALKDSCAYDFIMEKGNGLDLYVAQSGSNFSGGQRQRLAIARALMKKSGLLILDDSYSALDYATESHIKNSVFNHRDNCTVLTVSQRVSSIYNSDIIIVLDNGSVAGIGKHSELIKTCPVYNEICLSQNFNEEAN
jgi:ATP-binding cassette subfamily B multidrug efflux pump